LSGRYFSDRERGARARISEEITDTVWNAIAAEASARLEDSSFGESFPDRCPDGNLIAGCNSGLFQRALAGEVPGVAWPPWSAAVPSLLDVLDFVEFCFDHVAKPIEGSWHGFFQHSHLSFDREAGRAAFREKVNRIFARNGIAFELNDDGRVIRLAPEALRQSLGGAVFQTRDAELDTLLESARSKYLDPDVEVRKEALEKLWDAWERLKTIEPGSDKKAQASALLDKAASEPIYRAVLETEARAATAIGNDFRIRHHETNKVELVDGEQVDYFFHRLFALVQLLLRKSSRG